MLKTLLVGAFVTVTMGQENDLSDRIEQVLEQFGYDVDPELSLHLDKLPANATVKDLIFKEKPGKERPITKEIIDAIKSHTSLWTPFEEGENPLSEMTDEELENLAGTIVD